MTPSCYPVRFEANGGTGKRESVLIDAGEEYLLPECGFVAPPGKAFCGWDPGSPGDAIAVTEETVLTARWEDARCDAVYVFQTGAGSEWIKGSASPPEFTVTRSKNGAAAFSRYRGAEADGAPLGAVSAAFAEGGVCLILPPAYLAGLDTGEHTPALAFDDGVVSARFTVSPAPFSLPGAGEDLLSEGDPPRLRPAADRGVSFGSVGAPPPSLPPRSSPLFRFLQRRKSLTPRGERPYQSKNPGKRLHQRFRDFCRYSADIDKEFDDKFFAFGGIHLLRTDQGPPRRRRRRNRGRRVNLTSETNGAGEVCSVHQFGMIGYFSLFPLNQQSSLSICSSVVSSRSTRIKYPSFITPPENVHIFRCLLRQCRIFIPASKAYHGSDSLSMGKCKYS